MRGVAQTIDDYFFHLKEQNARGRIKEIRRLIKNTVIIGLLIASPWLVIHTHKYLVHYFNDLQLQDYTEEQRWQRVSEGLDRVECASNAAEQLLENNMNPATPDGLEYALRHGWCRFTPNED